MAARQGRASNLNQFWIWVSSALRAWAPGGWRECSLNFHSAPCIVVQRGAKFGGALPQPFVCLADRTRPMWIEFRVSVSDHCQRFGNCLGIAIPARCMDHALSNCLQNFQCGIKADCHHARGLKYGNLVKTSIISRLSPVLIEFPKIMVLRKLLGIFILLGCEAKISDSPNEEF